MSLREVLAQVSEKAGFGIGAMIGFLIIFAIGLVVLWVTGEPYH